MNHTTLPYIAAQILQNWLGCLIYLTRNEVVVRAQITNLRQRERSAQLIGFLSVLLAFSSLSLFVVTKRFQKRPDKRNSLRLRLRSDSLLSQWKGWLTLRALRWKMYDVFGVGLTAKRWHFYSQGWSAAEPLVENAESSAVRVPIKIEQRMTGSDGKAQILIGKLIGNDEMVATPRRLRMSEPMNDRFLDALYRHRRPTAASSLQTRRSVGGFRAA